MLTGTNFDEFISIATSIRGSTTAKSQRSSNDPTAMFSGSSDQQQQTSSPTSSPSAKDKPPQFQVSSPTSLPRTTSFHQALARQASSSALSRPPQSPLPINGVSPNNASHSVSPKATARFTSSSCSPSIKSLASSVGEQGLVVSPPSAIKPPPSVRERSVRWTPLDDHLPLEMRYALPVALEAQHGLDAKRPQPPNSLHSPNQARRSLSASGSMSATTLELSTSLEGSNRSARRRRGTDLDNQLVGRSMDSSLRSVAEAHCEPDDFDETEAPSGSFQMEDAFPSVSTEPLAPPALILANTLSTAYLVSKYIKMEQVPFGVLRLFRRKLRRIRQRGMKEATLWYPKPTIDMLRKDRFLNSLTSKTLAKFIDRLELRYYFPAEIVICMGLVERECFVVCKGRLNVYIDCGKPPIATLGEGDVLGSYGFTVDEPRRASVIVAPESQCGEQCLLWAIHKDSFEWMDAKEAEWKRSFVLRHSALLEPSFVDFFPSFADVSERSLRVWLRSGQPSSFFPREALPCVAGKILFVVRGVVSISFAVPPNRADAVEEFVDEMIAQVVDVQSENEANTKVEISPSSTGLKRGERSPSATTLCTVTVHAPMFLNVLPCAFPDLSLPTLSFKVDEECELLALNYNILDDWAQSHIKENCEQRRPHDTLRLDNASVHDALFGALPKSMRTRNLHFYLTQRPVTFKAGDRIEFDYASGMNALLVQRGELATRSTVFPDLTAVYFGDRQRTVAATNVVGSLISRRTIVGALCLHSSDADLMALAHYFAEAAAQRGERPLFASMPAPIAGEPCSSEFERNVVFLRGIHQPTHAPTRIVDPLRRLKRSSSARKESTVTIQRTSSSSSLHGRQGSSSGQALGPARLSSAVPAQRRPGTGGGTHREGRLV